MNKTIGIRHYDSNRGYNMQTAMGNTFWPLDPKPEDIYLEDIAWHLARICRWGGALKPGIEHYSVAQHSVMVSNLVQPENAVLGLMHDAAEAYCGDMIRPIKHANWIKQPYQYIESAIWLAIVMRFNLPLPEGFSTFPEDIYRADNIALSTERRDLMEPSDVDFGKTPEPRSQKIIPWTPKIAHHEFIHRAAELDIK